MICQTEPGRITSSFQPDESAYRPVNLVASSARVAASPGASSVASFADVPGSSVSANDASSSAPGVRPASLVSKSGSPATVAVTEIPPLVVVTPGFAFLIAASTAFATWLSAIEKPTEKAMPVVPPTDAAIEAAATIAWTPEESVARDGDARGA